MEALDELEKKVQKSPDAAQAPEQPVEAKHTAEAFSWSTPAARSTEKRPNESWAAPPLWPSLGETYGGGTAGEGGNAG